MSPVIRVMLASRTRSADIGSKKSLLRFMLADRPKNPARPNISKNGVMFILSLLCKKNERLICGFWRDPLSGSHQGDCSNE